jgi:hypothetical protein
VEAGRYAPDALAEGYSDTNIQVASDTGDSVAILATYRLVVDTGSRLAALEQEAKPSRVATNLAAAQSHLASTGQLGSRCYGQAYPAAKGQLAAAATTAVWDRSFQTNRT